MLELREQAMGIVQSMTCTDTQFKKMTGVDYNKFENFAYGFTNPKPKTIQRYIDAIQYMKNGYKGEISARDIFYKFYSEKKSTKDIADDYGLGEHIIVKLMNKNPRSRRAVLRAVKGQAA